MSQTSKEDYGITEENEGEFVFVDDCNKCPDDTACAGKQYKGKNICFCYHFEPVPIRKGNPCKRKTVQNISENNMGKGHLNASRPIDVHIPRTGNSSDVRLDGVNHITNHTNLSSHLIIAILVSCIFSLFFLVLCLIKRKSLQALFNTDTSKSKMEMAATSLGNGLMLLPTDRFVSNPTYESTYIDLAIRVFSQGEVALLAQIGQGCFGKVFKGDLFGDEVAIKVVKKEYSDEAMKEVETMATFSHPNILHLIGVVRSEDCDAPWLIFEFMKHGDLASVLRNSNNDYPSGLRPSFKATPGIPCQLNDSDDENVTLEPEHLKLTNDCLLDFASQIAEGMKYLSSQHFVHRDLAARNCLVASNGMVKISDFGLSRDVYTCDYYKIGGSRLLPLRWMAPESILYGRFTLESDVWAYGILLWEIFTWGRQPYFGHSNEEVVQLILDGVLLSPPSDCPPIICSIMEGCWKTEPRDRLKFTQISPRLNNKDFGKEELQNTSPLSSSVSKFCHRKPSTGTVDTWINSGYEVPKGILNRDYLEVV